LKSFFSVIVSLALICTGCKIKYSFTGASIAPDVKTVSVSFFPNQAPLSQPTLSQSFTEELRNIFLSQTNLSLIQKNGDLHFEGEITGYSTAPTALQGNQTAARNRLTITVNVRFTNQKDEKQNFEQSFSRFADYDQGVVLATIEESLIKQINDQLVQDIFNRAVSNW
jgi:hypothetical protein